MTNGKDDLMELKLNELTYIGKQFDRITDLSLFNHIRKPLEGDEAKSLEQMHVMKNGKLTEPLNGLFEAIAGADRAARLVMKMPGLLMEKSVYAKNSTKVLVENKGGKVAISLLEQDLERIRFEVSEHVGMSMQQHSGFAAQMPAADLMLLLSIVDWVRKASLISYAAGADVEPLTAQILAAYIQAPMNNGLATLLARTFDLEIPKPEQSEVEAGLNRFEASGWIKVEEAEITLNRQLMDLALNFSIIETQTLLEAFQMKSDGQILNSGVLIVTAGLKDLIAFTVTDDKIEMQTTNSSELIRWIETCLSCPQL